MLRTDTVTDVTTCITTQHSWAVTIGDSVTKLYNLIPGQGGVISLTGRVIAVLVESNSSLPQGL